jgi:hypothetical protein
MIGVKESKWLVFSAVKTVDGDKLGAAKGALKSAVESQEKAGAVDPKAALASLPADKQAFINADINGARTTLKADSFIPATMAAIFLLLLFYFKSIGGYKPLTIDDEEAAEKA